MPNYTFYVLRLTKNLHLMIDLNGVWFGYYNAPYVFVLSFGIIALLIRKKDDDE